MPTTLTPLGFDLAFAPCDVRQTQGLLNFNFKKNIFITTLKQAEYNFKAKCLKGYYKNDVRESSTPPISLGNLYRSARAS